MRTRSAAPTTFHTKGSASRRVWSRPMTSTCTRRRPGEGRKGRPRGSGQRDWTAWVALPGVCARSVFHSGCSFLVCYQRYHLRFISHFPLVGQPMTPRWHAFSSKFTFPYFNSVFSSLPIFNLVYFLFLLPRRPVHIPPVVAPFIKIDHAKKKSLRGCSWAQG